MSKLNLYETSWTDIVFENRNKEYGAYHLRQENTKTTFFALFMGVSLLTAAISIPMIYNYLNPGNPITNIVPDLPPIVVVDLVDPIVPNETKPEEAAMPAVEEPIAQNINTDQQLINPIITHSTEATIEPIATNEQLKNTTDNSTAVPGGTGVGTGTSAGTGTGAEAPSVPTNAIMNSAVLDKKPEFPGGINKFYTYVGNNFEKPELDSEMVIRVSVSFVIEKDGSMTDIKVLKDPGYGLGTEAIRVLKSLKTKWSPGILDGKAVRTSYNLPITIQTN
ncbi:energy transducer TonB [Flavobacterium sp. HJJ]|uniref:energy transducer TonB n=1 Tax=Flavobacterium sp. HJJ TaxID=2783792 RepID=UPI00188BEF26|nr:energy transducer TonB [Flavobacterium sp. HJJ]MBF4470385.1 energy transducer TonB [Flavobacterium sp. HJJ]